MPVSFTMQIQRPADGAKVTLDDLDLSAAAGLETWVRRAAPLMAPGDYEATITIQADAGEFMLARWSFRGETAGA